MGLVQNLKKKFNNWVDKTLAELSSAYIKQLAKQTSRKRDNSLLKESSPSLLTTERQSTTIVTSSPDTSEKIIMKRDKIALYAEFEDWIELDDVENLEIISIEKEPENEDRI